MIGGWSWTSAFAPQNAHGVTFRSIRQAQVKAGLRGQGCMDSTLNCSTRVAHGLVGDMQSNYNQRRLDANSIKAMKSSFLFMQAAQEGERYECERLQVKMLRRKKLPRQRRHRKARLQNRANSLRSSPFALSTATRLPLQGGIRRTKSDCAFHHCPRSASLLHV